MNEEMIFQRIEKILERMNQKEQLQSLAKEKGLPINELELTNDTKDAVVLSVIALMLAKQEGDPRYRKLSDFGMQKRSLKVELINDYKQRANMLLNKYRSHGTPDQVAYVDTPIDEHSTIQEEDDEYIDESSKTRKEIVKSTVAGIAAGTVGTAMLGIAPMFIPIWPFGYTLLELLLASGVGGVVGGVVGGTLGNGIKRKHLVPSKYAENVVSSIKDVLKTMVKNEDESEIISVKKFKKANKNLFDELKFWIPTKINNTKNKTWDSLPDELKRSHETMMDICSKMHNLKTYSKTDVKNYIEEINNLLKQTIEINESSVKQESYSD